jgi:hypothetical protein
MTQEQFDQLPLLLRRKVAMQALGVDRRTLDAIQDRDPELTVEVPGMRERRIRKERLARLLHLSV